MCQTPVNACAYIAIKVRAVFLCVLLHCSMQVKKKLVECTRVKSNHLDEVSARGEGRGRAKRALEVGFVKLGGRDGLVELREDAARLVDCLEALLHEY